MNRTPLVARRLRDCARHGPAVIAALCALAGPASSQYLFVTTAEVDPSVLTVDPATGAVLASVPISGHGALFGGITFDGERVLTIEGNTAPALSRLFEIQPATGIGTGVGSTGSVWNVRGIERNPVDGQLYATDDNDLFRVDAATGVVTFVATIAGPTLDNVQCIAIDAAGLGWAIDMGADGLFTFDLASGLATHVGNLSQPGFLFSFRDLAFDTDGTLWAVGTPGPGGLYTIDPTGPTATNVIRGQGFAGVAFAPVDCGGSSYCTSKLSAAGCVPTIGAIGQASASAGTGCFVRARELGPALPGLFFYSVVDRAALPFFGGTLCVAPPVRRLRIGLGGGVPNQPCSGSDSFDLNQVVAQGTNADLITNTLVRLQYWFFDIGHPDGTNVGLTNGLEIWICP